jgi:hypothetical protein
MFSGTEEHFRSAAVSDRSFSCGRHWLGGVRGWLSIDFLSSTPYILEVAKSLVFNPFNNGFYTIGLCSRFSVPYNELG